MKYISNMAPESKSRWPFSLLCTLLMISLAIFFCHTAMAKNDKEQDNSNSPYKADVDLKTLLKGKYPKLKDIISSVHATKNGFKGSLHLRGSFTPKKSYSKDGDRNNRARALAWAFMEEETSLLGIDDMGEMKEDKFEADKGYGGDYSEIYYQRYINDTPLAGAIVHITVGPDETIMFIAANLAPAPQEVYDKTTQTMLTQENISKILKQDVKASIEIADAHIKIKKLKKYAISSDPYVIWRAQVNLSPEGWRQSYLYTVDAVTGEILTKKDMIVE